MQGKWAMDKKVKHNGEQTKHGHGTMLSLQTVLYLMLRDLLL